MVAITWTAPANDNSYTSNHGTVTATYANNQLSMTVHLDANNSISKTWTINNGNALAVTEVSVDLNVRDVTQPAGPGTNPTPPGPNPYPDDPNSPFKPDYVIPDDVVRIHFGPGADSREDFYDIKKNDQLCAQPDSDPVFRRHAGPGKFIPANGNESGAVKIEIMINSDSETASRFPVSFQIRTKANKRSAHAHSL